MKGFTLRLLKPFAWFTGRLVELVLGLRDCLYMGSWVRGDWLHTSDLDVILVSSD